MRHSFYFIPKGKMIWPKPWPEQIKPNYFMFTQKPVLYDAVDLLDVGRLEDVDPPCIKATDVWSDFYKAFALPTNNYGCRYFITDFTSVQTLGREWEPDMIEQLRTGFYVPCRKEGCWRALRRGFAFCDRHS